VGPLAVVDPQPGGRESLEFRERFKEVCVEHLRPVAAIEPFDLGILIGLAWLDVVNGHALFRAPMDEALSSEFWPVVDADGRRTAMHGDELNDHRDVLCEYCFSGGPDKFTPFPAENVFEAHPTREPGA